MKRTWEILPPQGGVEWPTNCISWWQSLQGTTLEWCMVTEFRQPLQVQSHLEMPRILVQLGHTQRTQKLAPQTDPKWSPTWSLTRF